jgi:hypothetical protein
MTFLAGGFLAGLGLIGLPVFIHLIVRRKRKLIPWGAMQFLVGTPPRFRQRLQKLSELLVLLVRVLAVAALVLAFAQPLMQSGVLTRRSGENVLVIDASLSASRVVNGGRRAFDEEIAAAEGALKALGRAKQFASSWPVIRHAGSRRRHWKRLPQIARHCGRCFAHCSRPLGARTCQWRSGKCCSRRPLLIGTSGVS